MSFSCVSIEEEVQHNATCCSHNPASESACLHNALLPSQFASSESLRVRVSVERIPVLGDFEMLSYFAALESSGQHAVSILNITGTDLPTFVVKSSNAKLFRALPIATCRAGSVGCSLHLDLADAAHGTAAVTVEMAGNDPNHTVIARTRVLVVKIIPHPIIRRVLPAVSRLQGGGRVTIVGEHFGSLYSRGYGSDQEGYKSVSVTIAGNVCGDMVFESDARVTCTVPPGLPGICALHLNISDGYQSRGAVSGFTYMHVLAAGADQHGGFLGVLTGIETLPAVEMTQLKLNRAVRSMVHAADAIYVGGSFTVANGVKVGYVLSFDGSSSGVSPVGHGVDGAVHSMALFKSNTSHKALLVVGGSFYFAITNATALVRGGLAGDQPRSEAPSISPLLSCQLPRGAFHLDSRVIYLLSWALLAGCSASIVMPLGLMCLSAGWDASRREWVQLGSRPFLGRVDVVLANASCCLYVAGTSRSPVHFVRGGFRV